MATDRVQSGQLEREVDQTRGQLSETLEELYQSQAVLSRGAWKVVDLAQPV